MTGLAMRDSPFLAYWRALARAWAVLGLPAPSLGEACASWERGRAAYREDKALYLGKVES